MKLSDIIGMALKNLTRRKLRALLTILGVLIGTTSIVVMLSIGIGLNAMFTSQFDEMGSLNTIEIYPNYNEDMDFEEKEPVITDDQLKQIMGHQDIVAVTPIIRDYDVEMRYDEYNMWSELYAIKPGAMKIFDFKIAEGRLLNEDDEFEIVTGSSLWENMYDSTSGNWEPPEEPIDLYGEEIEFFMPRYTDDYENPEMYGFEVVGVLEPSGYDKNYSVFINIDYWQTFMNEIKEAKGEEVDESEGYERAWVYVNDMENVEQLIKDIEAYGVRARSDLEYIEQAKKQMAIIQAVLGGIGGISLLVAAIGITNTMIMAIYERTKEIGVMKVVGANIKDIKRLFLVEAALIGFLGGLAGLGLSYLLSGVVNHFAGGFVYGMGEEEKLSLIPAWLALVSLGFSTLIGIISGYLPARRAMKLSALQAIRTQ